MWRFVSRAYLLLDRDVLCLISAKPKTPPLSYIRLVCLGPKDHQRHHSTNHGYAKPRETPVCLAKNQDDFAHDENQGEFAGDVEKIYRILRKFHSRKAKLELALQESGIVMRPGLAERVLKRCGDAGNLGYSFFVWASKQPGYRHSYDVYKAIIRILGKMRHFGTVWALIDEMRKENPQLISPDLFVVLMRRFASTRMVKKAIEVLDEMPRYGCEPDEYVFGCLLDALCKNGSVKEAASLFEDMRYRFTPSIRHFTSLLYGWCREGKLMEAKHVLVQMREEGFEPDIVVYNNLLSGYTRAQKMGDAYDLLKEMMWKGCEPNATSYTTLIQGLCTQEKTEEAMRVLHEMERRGCEADVITYTTLISGFCKLGKVDKGYELLQSMIKQGLPPESTSYLHIMLAHEKKEDLEECLNLVEEMKKSGCGPNLNAYNVVIRLACKLGEVKEAIQVWNQIEVSRLSPGVDTFVIMVHGFIEQGYLVEACKYFTEMVGRGLFNAPHYGTLKELLNSLLRGDKLELAKDVWGCITRKGCDLNVYAWTIWIHALFSRGHVKEACSYCLDMMDSDLMPQPDTFAKLMRGLRKLYNRQFAAEITEKVRKMAEERQVTFKMYKRRGERDLKEKAKAKKEGRKRRARRRRWGGARARANVFSRET
ncbi:pentatricopeptide repeat-containing protein At3g49730-like [Punica granatum]|uniref:Pentatricopeptide repeat-containing protein At3g49730-like n=2 Tax=Punica granatum TaxID=22663 RepID=A0A6P8CRZ2_PUNGR|nr:pentatricopeptide repeat-containing protein At3g49730-like [Punica granatum]XP_031387370.1 pentatricopeptide repeat-containing protein At3g49730-like [Punica granatum]XP_031387371.1 pentatricopeptide repeat-containing protein At3g49730-like [Punica granatum]XP_031387372.1 pentatricopeptide repeat-containing protein At3g49730-like [Punica granatum]